MSDIPNIKSDDKTLKDRYGAPEGCNPPLAVVALAQQESPLEAKHIPLAHRHLARFRTLVAEMDGR